jgi:hypothetical protein
MTHKTAHRPRPFSSNPASSGNHFHFAVPGVESGKKNIVIRGGPEED